MNENNEVTTGQLAKRFGVPRHHIEYAIDSRGIEAVRRVGIIRLFDRKSQARIGAVLEEIEARRSAREANEPVAAMT